MSVRQVWRIWGMVVATLAVPILLWGGGGVPERERRAGDELEAVVPVLPAVPDTAADRTELATTALWGGTPGAAPSGGGGENAANAAAEWSLAGVYMKDDVRRVVLRYAGDAQPPRMLAEGETLPDGAEVAMIERDRVQLREAGGAHDTRWVRVNRIAPPR